MAHFIKQVISFMLIYEIFQIFMSDKLVADAGTFAKCYHKFVDEKGSKVYLGIHLEEKVEMEGEKKAKSNACVV